MSPDLKSGMAKTQRAARSGRAPLRHAKLRLDLFSLFLVLAAFWPAPEIGIAQAPERPPAEGSVAPRKPPRGDSVRKEDIAKPSRRTPAAPLHTIVIDPGHGGRDNGIRGAGGLLEKDVVFTVARKLSVLIRGRTGIRVVLTRTADYTLPLLERTAIANHSKGQLLISLHAEGSFRREDEGFRVFILGPAGAMGTGKPSPAEVVGLKAIRWDVAQSPHLSDSGRFARLIVDALNQETELRGTSVQEAQLLVLKGAQMPAVLVSIAHLKNPREESLLENDDFLVKVSRSLFKALMNFIGGQDASS